jgi:hypothetical protein
VSSTAEYEMRIYIVKNIMRWHHQHHHRLSSSKVFTFSFLFLLFSFLSFEILRDSITLFLLLCSLSLSKVEYSLVILFGDGDDISRRVGGDCDDFWRAVF